MPTIIKPAGYSSLDGHIINGIKELVSSSGQEYSIEYVSSILLSLVPQRLTLAEVVINGMDGDDSIDETTGLVLVSEHSGCVKISDPLFTVGDNNEISDRSSGLVSAALSQDFSTDVVEAYYVGSDKRVAESSGFIHNPRTDEWIITLGVNN